MSAKPVKVSYKGAKLEKESDWTRLKFQMEAHLHGKGLFGMIQDDSKDIDDPISRQCFATLVEHIGENMIMLVIEHTRP